MYIKLLNDFDFLSSIKVTSIGCGNMVDYWALISALKKTKNNSYKINYIGLDTISWNYKICPCNEKEILFFCINAIEYLEQLKCLISDVYFFPKSISEFEEEQINRICKCFELKKIVPTRFHIMVSLKYEKNNRQEDIKKVDKLIDAITSNGYKIIPKSEKPLFVNNPKTTISKIDNEFNHPNQIVDLLKCLNKNCKINRWPILSGAKIVCQIITFERNN